MARKCGICRQTGHNSRTCPEKNSGMKQKRNSPKRSSSKRRCSVCKKPGHNSRTCPEKNNEKNLSPSERRKKILDKLKAQKKQKQQGKKHSKRIQNIEIREVEVCFPEENRYKSQLKPVPTQFPKGEVKKCLICGEKHRPSECSSNIPELSSDDKKKIGYEDHLKHYRGYGKLELRRFNLLHPIKGSLIRQWLLPDNEEITSRFSKEELECFPHKKKVFRKGVLVERIS